MEIKGIIDPRHTRLTDVTIRRDDVLLPKVMAAKEGKVLVVLEIRKQISPSVM